MTGENVVSTRTLGITGKNVTSMRTLTPTEYFTTEDFTVAITLDISGRDIFSRIVDITGKGVFSTVVLFVNGKNVVSVETIHTS